MRAIVCDNPGPLSDLRIADCPSPVPGADQVVVDVRAAGVNYVDGLICQGGYQIRPPTPFVPGSELAGEISATGERVEGLSVGDRVIVTSLLGAFADQALVPAASVLRMPAGLSFAQAASLAQSYATALFALTRRTEVRPGEWVLVLGAGGGVGLAATDVARALGARVIAAASTPEKLEAARAMGAEATISYMEEDLKARTREISGGGADVVVDPVGGHMSEAALRATTWCGRVCVIGFASGGIPDVPLNHVLLNNRTVVGVDWGAWAFREQQANRALLEELTQMIEDGRLRPAAPAERPLSEAAAAMQDLLDRRVTGKVVLVP